MMSRKKKVSTISATRAATNENFPGERSPKPLEAKPSAALKPALPLAIRNRTPAPAMPPSTWAMM
jgi:hypothetical protein